MRALSALLWFVCACLSARVSAVVDTVEGHSDRNLRSQVIWPMSACASF
jgi:hypothetical protein